MDVLAGVEITCPGPPEIASENARSFHLRNHRVRAVEPFDAGEVGRLQRLYAFPPLFDQKGFEVAAPGSDMASAGALQMRGAFIVEIEDFGVLPFDCDLSGRLDSRKFADAYILACVDQARLRIKREEVKQLIDPLNIGTYNRDGQAVARGAEAGVIQGFKLLLNRPFPGIEGGDVIDDLQRSMEMDRDKEQKPNSHATENTANLEFITPSCSP